MNKMKGPEGEKKIHFTVKQNGADIIRSPRTPRGTKRNQPMYISIALIEKAKKLGINMSLCTERALRVEIKRCSCGLKQKKITNAPKYIR